MSGNIPTHARHLRLLAVLEALLAERSVTGAARRLHLSQPATSAALAQLRNLFADPLLVRSGREMLLTPRAQALLPDLQETMQAAGRLFASRAAVPPARMQRRFHLAVSDAVGQVIIPALVSQLAAQAPGITLRLGNAPAELPDAALADASLDMVIAHYERAAPGLRSTTLVRHPLVVVARQGHPLVKGRITARQFASLPQVTIFPHAAGIQEALQSLYARTGQEFRLAASVQNLSVAAGIVARSDAVALLSEPAARLYAAAWHLQVLALPAGLALPLVPVRAFWHERSQHDAASAWLRRQLMAVCAGPNPA